MKIKYRFILVVAISTLILQNSSNPVSAVFGLGKCEKMVSQVKSEDQLISALWRNYDRERSKKVKVKISDNQYLIQPPDSSKLIGMIVDINSGGLRAIKVMKSQLGCFTVSNQSKIINQETILSQNIRDWKKALNSKQGGNINFENVFPSAPGSFLKTFPPK